MLLRPTKHKMPQPNRIKLFLHSLLFSSFPMITISQSYRSSLLLPIFNLRAFEHVLTKITLLHPFFTISSWVLHCLSNCFYQLYPKLILPILTITENFIFSISCINILLACLYLYHFLFFCCLSTSPKPGYFKWDLGLWLAP